MSETLFRIRGADAGYRNTPFIRSMDISIMRGDFAALIGPNGAGKSTIIRLLSGALSPLRGEVYFMGSDIRKKNERELARSFSVVNRFSGELPDFSVRSFISLGRFPFLNILSGVSEEYLHAGMAERTGVNHLMERSIRELSEGELQLVQITRALVQNSSILLLDEPASNLDYYHMTAVMDLLKELHKGGTTIICALHDVNSALDYCSRIIAVKEGSVVFDGIPEKVIDENSMRGLYGADFHCGVNPVTGKPIVLPVPGDFR